MRRWMLLAVVLCTLTVRPEATDTLQITSGVLDESASSAADFALEGRWVPDERARQWRRIATVRVTTDGITRKLVGQGIATVTFFHIEGEGIFPTRIRYDFADPERAQ